VAPHIPTLHRLLYRLLSHPDDAADLVQDTLLTAYQKMGSFRGESAFGTWLYTIASRKGLDLLRQRKRWPKEAQLVGEERALASPEVMAGMDIIIKDDAFRYEYRQHVAYCFSCVAQSLEAELSTALMLRELAQLENREAATIMGLSESQFRHRVRQGRETIQERFDGLCALVSKEGVCYQCNNLREYCAEERRGPAITPIAAVDDAAETKLDRRLQLVREADLEAGPGHEIHAYLFRFMHSLWA